MTGFWTGKRVMVTGGAGFAGSYVVDELRARGVSEICVPRKKDYDLREVSDIQRVLREFQPHLIIHMAATVGGIGANRLHPGEYFYDNMVMGVHLLHESWKAQVEKVVVIGTVCAYPKFTPVPFREDTIWNGYPEETNAPYGVAKKALLVQSQAYRDEYGFNSIFLLPTNLYGPRDNFDLESSHVIPALIRKFYTAKVTNAPEVVLWGDGTPTREFLYAGDAAEGIVLAAERYNESAPVNLGSAFEIQIKDLATLIGDIIGYQGKIVWDTSKPNGQPRRKLDVTRAEEKFGFRSHTTFEVGLRKTIDWWRENGAEK